MTAWNWDADTLRKKQVRFTAPELDVKRLFGDRELFCKGRESSDGVTRRDDEIGIYDSNGVYYCIRINLNKRLGRPTFFIGDRPFFFLVTEISILCEGHSVIDVDTGDFKESCRDAVAAARSKGSIDPGHPDYESKLAACTERAAKAGVS